MNIFKIAMALNHIATALDTENYNKIKPYLNTIEEEVAKEVDKDEKEE